MNPTTNIKQQKSTLMITAAIAAVVAGLHAPPAPAANIAVTNVALDKYVRGQNCVQFDVSWDASWRASWTESGTWTNWDAAWIFVKYRCRAGADTNWHHATLSTNNSDHVAPAGSIINVGLSVNTNSGANFGAGVFLYRSENGSGPWTNTGVKLRWRYADDGVANTARVDVCVHAIEMVYVAEGAFYAGSGGTESGHFIGGYGAGASNNAPFLVQTEGQISVSNEPNCLWGTSSSGNNTIGPAGVLSNAFPKGFGAFYCMKYEISQGQYADFLNQLTYTQATNRYYAIAIPKWRYTITNLPPYSATAPTRACNLLIWADGAAYADWAGLRPMTELEYEKACRGPLYPTADEYAWGSTNITQITGFSGGTDGSGTETASSSSANCCYGDAAAIRGPVRCGIFATATSVRTNSGASYWGIMELSGNVWEMPVTVGNAEGRGFTGTHGDGKLDINGNANVPLWPGTGGSGAGFRGDSWYAAVAGAPGARVSDRSRATSGTGDRDSISPGLRAVRGAP